MSSSGGGTPRSRNPQSGNRQDVPPSISIENVGLLQDDSLQQAQQQAQQLHTRQASDPSTSSQQQAQQQQQQQQQAMYNPYAYPQVYGVAPQATTHPFFASPGQQPSNPPPPQAYYSPQPPAAYYMTAQQQAQQQVQPGGVYGWPATAGAPFLYNSNAMPPRHHVRKHSAPSAVNRTTQPQQQQPFTASIFDDQPTDDDEESIEGSTDLSSDENINAESLGLLKQSIATGYGATSTSSNRRTPTESKLTAPPPPPPRPSNLSTGSGTASYKQMMSRDRTGSADRITAPIRSPRAGHRRVSSDIPRNIPRHKRSGSHDEAAWLGSASTGSGGGLLPPSARRRTDPLRMHKQFPPITNLPSSKVSEGKTSVGGGHRRGHSRTNSLTGVQSIVSEASMVSHVSDIRRSSFYGGEDPETGHIQLHYPNEWIYLREMPHEQNPPLGRLYCVTTNDDTMRFEEYHLAAEDPSWNLELACGCECANCNGCTAKKQLLPPNVFCMPIRPTLYQRVLDEIAGAHNMPCGLYFCGHHEDVRHPSIAIAVLLVIVLFVAMGIVAYWSRDAAVLLRF